MKLIAVSQRVDIFESRNERRDALDQRWASFMEACSLLPLSVPNHSPTARRLIEDYPVSGVLLTGGNSVPGCGDDSAPERDETEKILLESAIKRRIPVLGVCRGMQYIQYYFGAVFEKIDGHVRTEHLISYRGREISINSYHNWAVKQDTPDLLTEASSSDSVIEAVSHRTLPVAGIMWHPERYAEFREHDINIFKQHFGVN